MVAASEHSELGPERFELGRGRALDRPAIVLGAACALMFCFREFVLSGGQAIAGDIGDNRFLIAILEHWRLALRGDAPIRSPIFFHPAPGVLGYSECVLLFWPPYEILRTLGCDVWLAFEGTLVATRALGLAALYVFLRRDLALGRGAAALGAALWLCFNGQHLQLNHAQFIAVAWLPVLMLLATTAWRMRAVSRGRAFACAAAFCLLGPLLFLTSFYVAWFALLTAGVGALVALAARVVVRPTAVARDTIPQWPVWRDALACLAVAAVASTPFLMVYLPVLDERPGRPFAEALVNMQEPRDLVNVGPENLVWGRLLAAALPGLEARPQFHELRAGLPPGLLVLFVATLLVATARVATQRDSSGGGARPFGPYHIATIAGWTAILTWLLSVRFGDATAWRFVHAYVPGGSAIRVPARLPLVLVLPVAAVAAVGFDALWRRARRPSPVLRRRAAIGATVLLAVFLLLEQVQRAPSHQIDRTTEAALLARIPAAPPDCRAFYVLADLASARPFFAVHIDAMLIALRERIPTLNGYSGWTPPRWELHDPFAPSYAVGVRRWRAHHGLDKGVYALDLARAEWRAVPLIEVAAATVAGDGVNFVDGGNGASCLLDGWAAPEAWGTWTVAREALVLLPPPVPAPGGGDRKLTATATAFLAGARRVAQVDVAANGERLATWTFDAGEAPKRVEADIPARLLRDGAPLLLTFTVHDPLSPAKAGLSPDARELGLGLVWLRIAP